MKNALIFIGVYLFASAIYSIDGTPIRCVKESPVLVAKRRINRTTYIVETPAGEAMVRLNNEGLPKTACVEYSEYSFNWRFLTLTK